jgi:hypothetical protein
VKLLLPAVAVTVMSPAAPAVSTPVAESMLPPAPDAQVMAPKWSGLPAASCGNALS